MQAEAKQIIQNEVAAAEARLVQLQAELDSITLLEDRKAALQVSIKTLDTCRKSLVAAIPPEPKEVEEVVVSPDAPVSA